MENEIQVAEPQVKYADFGTRLLAMLIDTVILIFLVIVIFAMFGVSFYFQGDQPPSFGLVIGLLLYYFIGIPLTSLFYYTLFERSNRQATPGKIVMKIIVVDDNFEKLSFAQSLGRSAGKWISGILLIGYLIALGNKKCQTLHDMMANTNVIFKNPNDIPVI